jgi:hypothetical protein
VFHAILIVAAACWVFAPRCCFASGGGGGGHAAPKASSGGHGAPAHGAEVGEEAYDDLESPTGFRGINLGEYKIRTYRSVSGQKNRVHFTIYARVKNEDVKEFRQLLKNRKIKVRDQVIVATRLVPVEDYDDPEFTKLRRRIQLRLRRTLPELPVDDVYVSEFTLLVETQ